MREQLIALALDRYGADVTASHARATATVRAVEAVLQELKPLVGEIATRALYLRSLHLTHMPFRWSGVPDSESQAELLETLRRDIDSRKPPDARLASHALLFSLANLLASLIGEKLTHRMLSTAWGIPISELHTEDKPT